MDKIDKQMSQLNSSIHKLKRALTHQKQLQSTRTIPQKYSPNHYLEVIDDTSTLQNNFNEQFKKLFFKHLDSVITSNTILLEIKQTRLETLTNSTKLISINTEPPSKMRKLHHKTTPQQPHTFKNDDTPISNKQREKTTKPSIQKTGTKRKNLNRDTTKVPHKIQKPFLEIGQHLDPKIT